MPLATHPSGSRTLLILGLALLGLAPLGGCAVASLAGAMQQSAEYQKRIEVLPKYDDLADQRVAVLVNVDMYTQYEHPMLEETVRQGVSARLQKFVPESRVISPLDIKRWQYQTAQWDSMPYGEMVESLGVDRVILIDIYEYRLNPPGNSWEWEGVAVASVGIIEADSLVPDMFVDEFEVYAAFPQFERLTRSEASANVIEYGLQAEFIKRISWLFYTHLEPKYPDKYQPELDRNRGEDI